MSHSQNKPDNPALLFRHALRRDLSLFTRKAWPDVASGNELEWNWHHEAIINKLEDVLAGRTRRLIINVQPRSGKSIIASQIFPAFALGIDPRRRLVGVSYSMELSGTLGRKCRLLIELPWYREVFPETMISRSRSASYDFETTRGGGKLSASVGGSLTGRGGSIIIMDDVIKPDEVNSDVARENLNEWYRSTLSSRLDDKRNGAIILVMQRLHQYDLAGMLIEAGGWEVLSLPAVAQSDERIALTRGRIHRRSGGDLLHPAREPAHVLSQIRTEMGSRAYAAQYLQNPLPAEGNLFRAAWLRSFDPAGEDASHGEVVQSWDTGIKTGDNNSYSVCVTARIVRGSVRIADVWRGRLEFPELERKVNELALLHGAKTLLIEDRASGQELIQNLRARRDFGVPAPIARAAVAEKKDRAAGVSSMVEAGSVFLPTEASWLSDFLGELLAFPSGKFDDQVDAFTQLLGWVRDRSMFEVPTNAGPIEMTGDLGSPSYARVDELDIQQTIDAWGA